MHAPSHATGEEPPVRTSAVAGAWRAAVARLVAPIPALRVDTFRVLAGLLVLAYFARHLAELGLYHGHAALVPHAASRLAFPFTWQPIFPSGASDGWVSAVYALGCALAVAVVVGVRPRSCAFVLYAIVVAIYRRDFLVMFVDDVVIHLLLFWLVILPTGTTLNPHDWLADRGSVLARWRSATVRGTSPRLFLANLALLYLVAGTSKWASPLWRSGDAIFAVAKLPMSFVADLVTPEVAPALRVLDYATMVVEPLLGVAIVFSSRPRVRAALVAAMVAFHLAIVATVDVPFANLGCLVGIPLLFRSTRLIEKNSPAATTELPRIRGRERVAVMVLALLVGAMTSALFAPPWRTPDLEGHGKATTIRGGTAESGGAIQTAFFAALWCGGLAQQYRLLDWIDDRNFSVTLRFRLGEPGEEQERTIPADRVLPRDMRSSLLLSYLGGVTWMPVPPEHLGEVRWAIADRVIARACDVLATDGAIALEADYERAVPGPHGPRTTLVLARGRCGPATHVSVLSR